MPSADISPEELLGMRSRTKAEENTKEPEVQVQDRRKGTIELSSEAHHHLRPEVMAEDGQEISEENQALRSMSADQREAYIQLRKTAYALINKARSHVESNAFQVATIHMTEDEALKVLPPSDAELYQDIRAMMKAIRRDIIGT